MAKIQKKKTKKELHKLIIVKSQFMHLIFNRPTYEIIKVQIYSSAAVFPMVACDDFQIHN